MKIKKNLIICATILFTSIGLLCSNNFKFKNSKNTTIEETLIATYLDGKFSDNMPKKTDGYVLDKLECNDGVNIEWNDDIWGFTFLDDINDAKCKIYFKFKTEYDFDYTGEEQEFLAVRNGNYKIETWGAQGGGNTTYQGGTGAYASGVIYLNSGDKLHVNVGGSGILNASTSGSFNYLTGGYNGGGNSTVGGDPNGYSAGGGSGGGATHIAKVSGLLSTLENNKDDIIIVSAGGGGADTNSYDSSLSHSGTNGSGISSYTTAGQENSCTIATQTTGYSFGQGGNYISKIHAAGGGGGGYYGGGGGGKNGPGCGGSSYIGNALLLNKTMYCNNCTESMEMATKTVATTCSEETPTENCAKKGNGYAKITLLANINVEYYNDNIKTNVIANKNFYNFSKIQCSNNSNLTWDEDNWQFNINNYVENDICKIYFTSKPVYEFAYTGTEQIFTANKTGTYRLEVWGAQGGSSDSSAGTGAYSVGRITLNKNDKIYINVGGTTTSTTGGYNGGGTGAYGGGGATHIAKTSGKLSALSTNKDNIIIVAAGGGGNGKTGAGGFGGGIYGTKGSNGACENRGGAGGSQTAGGGVYDGTWASSGSFGQGGNYKNGSTGGAGGGGLYGGGSGTSGDCYGGGGGGSSYIGNSLLTDKAMYCYNCTTSNDTNTKTISTTCNEETPTENCAKKGNGYARITFIKEN